MDMMLPYLPKNYQRSLFVFATVLFVLFTSCPVKSSIKSLISIPVHTEQGSAKNNHAFLGNGQERCAIGETRDAKIFQTASVSPNHLLPVMLLTAIFLFLPDDVHREEEYPFYGKLNTASTLPLFLQYRKLII